MYPSERNAIQTIITVLSRNGYNPLPLLLSIAKTGESSIANFLIELWMKANPSIVQSDSAMRAFCNSLFAEGFGHLAGIVLRQRLAHLTTTPELSGFLQTVSEMRALEPSLLAEMFEAVDHRISVRENYMNALAARLQALRPHGAVCRNSAHIYAVEVLASRGHYRDIREVFGSLTEQRFPSETNQEYIQTFAKALLKAAPNRDEQTCLLHILFRAPKGYLTAYGYELCMMAHKYPNQWNTLMEYGSAIRDEQLNAAGFAEIVQALADAKLSEKSVKSLSELLRAESSLDYFFRAATAAEEKRGTNWLKQGMEKLLSGIFKQGQ